MAQDVGVHFPSTQVPAPQLTPHAPQLFGSMPRWLHRCPHVANVPQSRGVHVPLLHAWPSPHAWPHEPQFALSLATSTHVSLQAVSPVGHGTETLPPQVITKTQATVSREAPTQ